MTKLTDHFVSKIAIAVVIGGISLAHTVYAADTSADQTTEKSGDMKKHGDGMHRIDDRIKALHDKLNITPEQEQQWKKVTEVMRQNEASIHKLVEARHENESANAVDDLKSYEGIAKAYERGISRLIPVFKTFYNGLTPEQKASADDMFGKYEGRKEDKTNEGDTGTPTAAPSDNNNSAPASDDSQ